jgi:hypothetical protein
VRRWLGPAVAVGAALVLGLVVAFFWRSATDDSNAPDRLGSQISVLTRVDPRVHGLGDPIMAELVVLIDTNVVDFDSVRPVIDPEPYDRLGTVQQTVTRSGSVAKFSYRYPLVCLAEACTPSEENPVAQLPIGTVFYRFHGAPRPVSREIEWPEMTFVKRATDDEITQGHWRVDSPAILPVTYRFNPGWLAALFFVGSLAFLLAAAAIVWQFLESRREPEPEPVVDRRPPLERALDAARLASLNGAVPERRRALERVARELAALDEEELAARARTLAWSPEGATRQEVEDLARDAREAIPADPSPDDPDPADQRKDEEEVLA